MKIRSPLLTKLAAHLLVGFLRLLFRTCRHQVATFQPRTNCYEDTGEQRYLYCVWHDLIAMTIFSDRPRRMAGLVSRHQDGSYLADSMKIAGITPVRGSSSRGGTAAMKTLLSLASELHIAITPDGPRGPRRQLKDGILFLASHTGRAIIPVAHACRRSWKIRGSWTDLMLPVPFTTTVSLGGEPLHVPHGVSRGQLEHYAHILQRRMDDLQDQARLVASGQMSVTEVFPAAQKAA